MENPVVLLSEWMRPRLLTICTALVATVLIIYGNNLNRIVRNLVRRWHFAVRLLAFVLICAFGYGFMTVFLGSVLARGLGGLGNGVLSPVVLVCFLVIGVLAEQKRVM